MHKVKYFDVQKNHLFVLHNELECYKMLSILS